MYNVFTKTDRLSVQADRSSRNHDPSRDLDKIFQWYTRPSVRISSRSILVASNYRPSIDRNAIRADLKGTKRHFSFFTVKGEKIKKEKEKRRRFLANDRSWADALSCPVKYNRYNNLNRQYISDIDLTKGNTGRSWDNDVKYNSQVTIRVYTGIDSSFI